MQRERIGVSVLTNGARLSCLQRCIETLLEHCNYRPLVIGVVDNGSTDETSSWLANPPWVHGVNFRFERWEKDQGCAFGTNRAMLLVGDCRYALHIESDWEHLPYDITGEGPDWLDRALHLMRLKDVAYLYLRRMVNEREMMAHWWSQWCDKMGEQYGRYVKCDGFWWSNNPALRDNWKLIDEKVLPLDETTDGPKGSEGWSRPELSAQRPSTVWMHRWGLFAHMPVSLDALKNGCGRVKEPWGGCQYGFLLDGKGSFCRKCLGDGYNGMKEHEKRFRG